MTLEVQQLSKRFAGVQAVADVSFSVAPGECVALIGPNGAGKSTTFGCIAGQHLADSGSVDWNGLPMHHSTAAERLAHGIARTFQVAQVFEALSVLQNVQLAQQARKALSATKPLAGQDPQEALSLLRLLGLDGMADRIAGNLPYGAKKRLELGIALAGIPSAEGHAPHLLLLDEPAAGLASDERASLMALVKSLASGHSGLAVLYTEHNMDAVFGVADRVIVLMDGCIVAQGTPEAVAADATVRQRYLGQSFAFKAGEPHA